MSLFGKPGEEGYDALVAENSFVHDIQLAIERALDERDMSQAQLAGLLGVSEARVSQILSNNGRNLQARTIARIAHALGMKAFIDFVEEAVDWENLAVEEVTLTSATFTHWVSTALEVLERHGKNDNGWTATSGEDRTQELVAA